ncbi:MAG: metallophosphoesterase [Candidatus Nanohalobium sp.]
MKLAVISDIHITEDVKEKAFQKLEKTVPEIQSQNPDLVIVLGDMIGGAVTTGKEAPEETEGLEELRKVRDIIEEVDAETLYLRGNHEQDVEKHEFAEVFNQETYGVKQVKEENFIYLDSSAPELSGSRGQVSREQLDFLDEKLEELEDAFLIIHHPIHFRDLSHSYYWDVYPERAFCGNKKEINNVIEKHGNVKAVLNSHIHDLNLEEFKDNFHFTNPPFISESRDEGFYEYFSVMEAGEEIGLKVYGEGELDESFEI